MQPAENARKNSPALVLDDNVIFLKKIQSERESAGKGGGNGVQNVDTAVVAFHDKILDQLAMAGIQKLGADAG